MKNFKEHMKIYGFMIKSIWEYSKKTVFLILLASLSSAGLLLINVFLPKLVIDSIMSGAGFEIVTYVVLMVLANVILAKIPGYVNNYINNVDISGIYQQVRYNICEKTMKLDYSMLENKDYMNLKDQADFIMSTNSPLSNFVQILAEVFVSFVVVIFLAVIAFSFSWVLGLVLLLVASLNFAIGAWCNMKMGSFMGSIEDVNREFSAYMNIIYGHSEMMDVKLFSMHNLVNGSIYKLMNRISEKAGVVYVTSSLAAFFSGILDGVSRALSYIYISVRAVSNVFGPQISLGSFALYTSAFVNFNQRVRIISQNYVDMIMMRNMTEPYYRFMNLPEAKAKAYEYEMPKSIDTIEFKDVWFKYPSSEDYVLKNLSFNINKGEKISIVGLNGAGKTTIIKLMTRLYEPTKGEILLNGLDISKIKMDEYQKLISVVFQDYNIYNFPVAETVASKTDYDREKVTKVLKDIDIYDKINSLSSGMDTKVSMGYSETGEKLSQGQFQKLAIARSLYKDSELVILDEPTSALDPKSEAEIYENFNYLVKEKTSIYISHRMSSSIFCDRILLINNGTVEDFDTHHNLMQKTDSLYYKMFNAQKENYEYQEEEKSYENE
ncbi:ABC transporter ATP-binding protein [Fenollaria sporofastidiosus]|uniref:ABC transporter ATP-binding protein n=1 Tax=Fenollaria sporofastidiosus TaxID=2811778 RepID=UPI001C000C44|nr:ABC transporter ATP-binding protein [Fenollaria sporofastidiosus]